MALNSRLTTVLQHSTNASKPRGKSYSQLNLPGFDEQVTIEEVNEWIDVYASHISERRRPYYAESYNIPEKIRQMKRKRLWPIGSLSI